MASNSVMLTGRQARNFWLAARRNARHHNTGGAIGLGHQYYRSSPLPPPCQYLYSAPFSTTSSNKENVEPTNDGNDDASEAGLAANNSVAQQQQSNNNIDVVTAAQHDSITANPTTPTTSADPPSSSSRLSQISELSKARLSALVVSTTAFGFVAAGPAALTLSSLPTFAAASIGTALCASSAATFNQALEVDRDAKMKRTKNRPLVTGAVSTEAAVGLGCFTGMSGGLMLGLGTDPITTALGLGNVALYAGLYTYLKPRSEWNTWIGAVVGAVPPVMGWTAAGGSPFDAEAVLLGSTLFLWQFPHFFALNWMYRADYARGGFAMVAVNDPGGDRTATLIRRYGAALATLPFASAALEVTSPMFAVDGGLLLNGYALYVASRFDRERSNANARKVFLTSLWYLPCAMMLFLIHSRRWHEEVADGEEVVLENGGVGDASVLASMQKLVNRIQSKGRDLCMHEAIASTKLGIWFGSETSKTAIDGSKCPITIGKAVAESANSSMAAKKEIELKQESVREESR